MANEQEEQQEKSLLKKAKLHVFDEKEMLGMEKDVRSAYREEEAHDRIRIRKQYNLELGEVNKESLYLSEDSLHSEKLAQQHYVRKMEKTEKKKESKQEKDAQRRFKKRKTKVFGADENGRIQDSVMTKVMLAMHKADGKDVSKDYAKYIHEWEGKYGEKGASVLMEGKEFINDPALGSTEEVQCNRIRQFIATYNFLVSTIDSESPNELDVRKTQVMREVLTTWFAAGGKTLTFGANGVLLAQPMTAEGKVQWQTELSEKERKKAAVHLPLALARWEKIAATEGEDSEQAEVLLAKLRKNKAVKAKYEKRKKADSQAEERNILPQIAQTLAIKNVDGIDLDSTVLKELAQFDERYHTLLAHATGREKKELKRAEELYREYIAAGTSLTQAARTKDVLSEGFRELRNDPAIQEQSDLARDRMQRIWEERIGALRFHMECCQLAIDRLLSGRTTADSLHGSYIEKRLKVKQASETYEGSYRYDSQIDRKLENRKAELMQLKQTEKDEKIDEKVDGLLKELQYPAPNYKQKTSLVAKTDPVAVKISVYQDAAVNKMGGQSLNGLGYRDATRSYLTLDGEAREEEKALSAGEQKEKIAGKVADFLRQLQCADKGYMTAPAVKASMTERLEASEKVLDFLIPSYDDLKEYVEHAETMKPTEYWKAMEMAADAKAQLAFKKGQALRDTTSLIMKSPIFSLLEADKQAKCKEMHIYGASIFAFQKDRLDIANVITKPFEKINFSQIDKENSLEYYRHAEEGSMMRRALAAVIDKQGSNLTVEIKNQLQEQIKNIREAGETKLTKEIENGQKLLDDLAANRNEVNGQEAPV